MTLAELLVTYINNQEGFIENLSLGMTYLGLRQYATAFSFLLRAAEFSKDTEEQYSALLFASTCFMSLPNRVETTKCLLLHCVRIQPTRPEAYYLLARLYAATERYHEGLSWAEVGLAVCDFTTSIIEGVGYFGEYNIKLEQGICLDHIDQPEKAKEIMLALTRNDSIDVVSRNCILNNLAYSATFEHAIDVPNTYIASKGRKLLYAFPGSKAIARNHSQVFQDLFVLTANKGRRGMQYLEIGADDPMIYNNTYLLETIFGWTGLSIERDPEDVKKWSKVRAGDIRCLDALNVNYKGLLSKMPERDYGYLQIDIDDPYAELEILKKIPFAEHRFATVTIEHDWYLNKDDKIRETIRSYLTDRGYILAFANVSTIGTFAPFEDWFIHPELTDMQIDPGSKDRYGLEAPSIFLK